MTFTMWAKIQGWDETQIFSFADLRVAWLAAVSETERELARFQRERAAARQKWNSKVEADRINPQPDGRVVLVRKYKEELDAELQAWADTCDEYEEDEDDSSQCPWCGAGSYITKRQLEVAGTVFELRFHCESLACPGHQVTITATSPGRSVRMANRRKP